MERIGEFSDVGNPNIRQSLPESEVEEQRNAAWQFAWNVSPL